MDGLNINLMLIIVVIAALCKMVDGYKKGMIKEIVSMISMVVLCIVAALVAYGVNSYHDGKGFNVAVAAVLLILVLTVHHLLGLVFFSAKLFSKLPIVHFVDKMLGIVFGVFEVVLVLWTLYAFIIMMDIGIAGRVILSYTNENVLLTWIYEHNWLVDWINGFLHEFDFVPLAEILGLN